MADGLKITLSGIGSGLTTDKQGRALLPKPFVFQCPPLEEYAIAHSFNFGTYDTVDDDQFSRRGSRQLNTWQFDTLVMYLGTDAAGRYAPDWVPYPTLEPGGQQYHRPEWYIDQLRKLFNAGAPFHYVAAFQDSTTVHQTNAVLTAFNESHRHGEGDAIYLTGVSFMEWRDPRGQTKKAQSAKFPAHVRFRKEPPGGRFIAYNIKTNKNVKTKSKTRGTTFADLARDFYGNGAMWRTIANANKCKGGSGDSPIFSRWFPKRISKGKPNVTVTIPKKPDKPKVPKTAKRTPAKKK